MSEYKHTSGPWVISNNGKPSFGNFHIRQDPKDWKGHGYQSICSSHASTKGTAYGEMFAANAKLIASAPALIDALDEIINEGSIDRIKSIARDAIRNATGVEK